MRRLLKWMGIVLAVVVVVLGSLAGIGFATGGKRQEARALRLAQSGQETQSRRGAPRGSAPPESSNATAASAVGASPPSSAAAAPTPITPELIARLDGLEAQGRYADAAVEAFDAAPSCSAAERTALIAWLKERVKDGRIPAMYWLARAYFHAGDQREAAKWYAGASLTGRVDAARLADASAAAAIPTLEAHFAEIKKALKDDANLRRTAIAWALEYEETSVKERGVAGWIAAHGMNAFRGGTPDLVTDDQWQAKRTEIRESWRRMD